jgi:hypothetical protein
MILAGSQPLTVCLSNGTAKLSCWVEEARTPCKINRLQTFTQNGRVDLGEKITFAIKN